MESAPGISPDRVCSRCGLTVGQRGSFTYWIFKDNRCQCDDAKTALHGLSAQPALLGAKDTDKLILNQRYELLERVGQGGIGFVYRGRDMTTGEIVALKIMRPELARNELATKRVMREVEAVSSVSNLNLGKVYGYGQEQDGAPYLVMEFVEGRNMEDLLQAEGKLKLGRALEIFLQICGGLIGAHTNGIIHRDVKPSNVIINQTANGQEHAKIVDFGFAKLLRDANDSIKLTQEGEVFGSPAYMSPEQCLGEELDVRSDIYSLGCLMYETLVGVPPLVGENVLATVAKQIRSTAASMQSRDASIPGDIDAIVLKCLSKERLHRYQSITDLRQDLEKVKRGEQVKATVKRAPTKLENSGAGRNSLRSTESAYGKMTTMMSVVLVAVLVVGIGVAALAFILLTKQSAKNITLPSTVPSTNAAPLSNNAAPSNNRARPSKNSAATSNNSAAISESSAALNQSALGAQNHVANLTRKPPPKSPYPHHLNGAGARPASTGMRSVEKSLGGGWNQLKGLRTNK